MMMSRLHRRRSSPKLSPSFWELLTHPFVLLLWSIFCVLASLQLLQSALSARQAFKTKEHAEELLRQEEAKGAALLEKLQEAQSPYAQEKIIRDELNMQKPGEIILQLPTPIANSQ